MDSVAGKGAFVTGAASGIGLAMARRFVREGMRVALVDVETGPLEKAAAELRDAGGEVLALQCDVSDLASVETAASQAFDSLGSLHVVCNNAGVVSGGPTIESSAEDWDWVLGVNLMGVVHGVRTLTPRIVEQGEGGHIVNTASVAGLISLPSIASYNASKAAVVALSETIRLELAPLGIGVSVLCPGFVKTRITEADRNRPSGARGVNDSESGMGELIQKGMDPDAVADAVLQGILHDTAHILTHPTFKPLFQARVDGILGEWEDV